MLLHVTATFYKSIYIYFYKKVAVTCSNMLLQHVTTCYCYFFIKVYIYILL